LSWLNHCEQFFYIQETADASKVFLAMFYMTGDAAQWYMLLERNHRQPASWDEFTKRFGPSLWGKTVGDLIQLRQDRSVANYQTKFMSLQARCKDLTEKHQINIFTAGLHNPLHVNVELENPEMLNDAMALAWAYEQRLTLADDVPAKHPSSRATPACLSLKPMSLPKASSTSGAKELTTTTTSAAPRLKRLTTAEMVVKREKRECYNCSEKFSREHLKICPMKRIYLLHMDHEEELMAPDGNEPCISLNNITGISPVATMCLVVRIITATVTALVDSGSMHSFISEATARQHHLQLTPCPGLHVTVANGDRVASAGVCGAIHFFIDREEFITGLFVIPLDDHEMVLAVHWLRTLGPILWDFDHARVSCWRDDHRVVWQGVPSRRDPAAVVQATTTSDPMDLLLQEYTAVFDTLIGLLSPRRHNHHNHLLPDTLSVVVCLYRYSQLVKDELERQCRNMLEQGIIHPSSSVFSSSVLLVKKHDGTWRFCVDYMALNAKTVRDAFLIPVVDELLDELRGALLHQT
jgi:hypothetical protein